MDYTISIGNVVELQCISKFISMGFQCSIPYGNSAKYDFIAELPNGELLKIQCKSSNWVKDNIEPYSAFSFNCISSTTNTKKTTRHTYTKEQVDYFATYFENQVYLVPFDECSTIKTLRFKSPLNGNKNYSNALDYTIEKVLGHLQSENFILDLEKHQKQAEETKEKESIQQGECPICGAPVWKTGNLCVQCYHIQNRKSERPNRDTLKQLIRTTPFTVIGKKFGVTDNAIRKWCDAENLPRRSREIKQYTDEEWNKI